jgi:hypothetical protein
VVSHRAVPFPISANSDGDLPVGLAGAAVVVGSSYVVERESAVEYRTDREVSDQCGNLGELFAVGFHEELLEGDVAFRGESVGCVALDGDDRAARLHHVERPLQGVAAQHVEYEVAGLDDLFEPLVRVVDELICAQILDETLVLSTGRRSDPCTGVLRELDGQGADAA